MAAAVAPGERVLEVGGGLGVLTRELSKRGAHVRVVEIEPALARHLQRLKLPGVTVECADALDIELGAPDKVVANIPYSVSGELVERLLDSRAGLIVLMVQQEVAARLASEPGSKNWARLPAVVQREYAVEVVERVPANAFFPQPKVASAVIRLRRKPKAGAVSPSAYRAVVGALFSGRRKKVRNTVARAAAAVRAPIELAVPVAEELGVADRRPEELSVGQFEALAGALASLRTTK